MDDDSGRPGRRRLRRAVLAAVVAAALVTTGAVVAGRHADLRRAAAASTGVVLGPLRAVLGHRVAPGAGADAPGDRAWTDRTEGGRYRSPPLYSPADELRRVGPLPAGWRASVRVVDVDGRPRDYLLVVPSAVPAGRRLPLYVVLHGRRMDPATIERLTDLPAVTGPAVLAYPAGIGDSWNAGGCCGFAHRIGVDDVAFVRTVVAHLDAAEPVDAGRTYAIGFSNGGRMAYRLACALPGVFAGMAAVEAVPVFTCRHLHPLDVEIVAQRLDPLLAIGPGDRRRRMDGYLEPTVDSTVGSWRSLDGCPGTPSVRTEGRATLATWACPSGARLQYTLYSRGAHRWPVGGGTTPSGQAVILPFLQGAGHPS
jgi:polyhydroxybutyrate depolymerase